MKKMRAIAPLALTTLLPLIGRAEEALEEAAQGVTQETVQEVAAAANADLPTWFVVVMGMGIVFIGLVCLIVLITAMGAIMKRFGKKQAAQVVPAPAAAPAAQAESIPNRGEVVAAIAVALAEELGKDVQAIRILTIKRA